MTSVRYSRHISVGGVHGHPDGTHAGAKALRAAVDVVAAGHDIETAAEETPELATALTK